MLTNEINDNEFEITAEMMVHDYDDERTLDDEENMEGGEDPQSELLNLQKEQNMPLEELLALYGYREQTNTETSSSSEDVLHKQDLNLHKNELHQRVSDADCGRLEENSSALHLLYAENADLHHIGNEEDDDDDYDDDYDDYDYSFEDDGGWRKQVLLGKDHQAILPEDMTEYDDALPYENEDTILWNPYLIDANLVELYLKDIEQLISIKKKSSALSILLQCGYNTVEAIRRCKLNPYVLTSSMTLWSEDECKNFEEGIQIYGKDFYNIHKHKVYTRSIKELIYFYYLWKKTMRHDIFASKVRFEKRKYISNPAITDYMTKFLDEQENPISCSIRERTPVPNIHCLIYGDPKRHRHTDFISLQLKEEEEKNLQNSHFENLAKQYHYENFKNHISMLTSESKNCMDHSLPETAVLKESVSVFPCDSDVLKTSMPQS